MKVFSNNLFGVIPELMSCFLLLPFKSWVEPGWMFCFVPINQDIKFNDSETEEVAGEVEVISCDVVVFCSCAKPIEQTKNNAKTTTPFSELENDDVDVVWLLISVLICIILLQVKTRAIGKGEKKYSLYYTKTRLTNKIG